MSDESIDQNIDGDHNIQVAGDLNVNMSGVDPKDHAEVLAENKILKEKLAMFESNAIDAPTPEDIEMANEALNSAGKMKELGAEFNSKLEVELGDLARIASRWKAAETYYHRALLEIQPTKVIIRISIQHRLASVYRLSGQGPKAEECIKTIFELSEKLDDTSAKHYWLSLGWNQLGGIYREQQRYNDAMECLENSISSRAHVIEPIHEKQLHKATILGHIATMQYQEKHYREAEANIRDAIHINLELGDHVSAAENKITFGNIAASQDHYEEAERWYRQALSTFEDEKMTYFELLCIQNLAQTKLAQESVDEAEDLYRRAYKLAFDSKTLPLLWISTIQLCKILQSKDSVTELETIFHQTIELFNAENYDPRQGGSPGFWKGDD
jgi:tetratricopeptide (TPR) repeat protein